MDASWYGHQVIFRVQFKIPTAHIDVRHRMATDLNIHRKSKFSEGNSEEDRARNFEVHNRERTWLVCYALDRSISAQMGKPYGIREECVCLVARFYFNRHQFPVKPGELGGASACDSVLTNCRTDFVVSRIQLHHPECKEMVHVQDGHP